MAAIPSLDCYPKARMSPPDACGIEGHWCGGPKTVDTFSRIVWLVATNLVSDSARPGRCTNRAIILAFLVGETP
jgi:hypothetical protein